MSGELTIVEHYRLKFSTPTIFITSLQKVLNYNFRQNAIHYHVELELYNSKGVKITYYRDWDQGKNIYKIINSHNSKVVALLVVYNISNKFWYRYQSLPIQKSSIKHQLIINYIQTIFSEYIAYNQASTNIDKLPKKQKAKIAKHQTIELNLKYLGIPLIGTFLYYLQADLNSWPKYFVFLGFLGLAKLLQLYKASIDNV